MPEFDPDDVREVVLTIVGIIVFLLIAGTCGGIERGTIPLPF